MARTYSTKFDGTLLKRGFWLYVWEIRTEGATLYYVGRTGDSSSSNAQSPFNRMAHHLSVKGKANVLWRYLNARKLQPEDCDFRIVAYGPILEEVKAEHQKRRDTVAAMECALARDMRDAGFEVMNDVRCKAKLDEKMYADVRSAFANCFPRLAIKAAPLR